MTGSGVVHGPLCSHSSDLDIEGPSTKKARVEDTDFSMASLARGEVTEVSGHVM